jgi:hypothetical protein
MKTLSNTLPDHHRMDHCHSKFPLCKRSSRCNLAATQKALKLAQTLQRNVGGQPFFRSLIAEVVARCGEIEVAITMIDDRRLFAPETPLSNFRRASLAVAIGGRSKSRRKIS